MGSNFDELVSKFIKTRKEGLSPLTLKFYKAYLTRAQSVVGLNVQGIDISLFLKSRQCANGGKHAYFRTLRTFYNWLYSRKSGYRLNPQDNPIQYVDIPKKEKRILPSVTETQLEHLLAQADSLRDKCIIQLLFDSGMRLSEITKVKRNDIDWANHTITIIGKGNKQRRAPFTQNTAEMLQIYLGDNHATGTIWGLTTYGIETILKRLGDKTGIKCNPHSFRRGFACNLHKKGLSTLDIMHLGGWEDLSMVLNYTRSITFDDCLKHYREIEVTHFLR